MALVPKGKEGGKEGPDVPWPCFHRRCLDADLESEALLEWRVSEAQGPLGHCSLRAFAWTNAEEVFAWSNA